MLTATTFAVWSTYHTTLKKMSGQLVIGCIIMFNIQHVNNWECIQQNEQICVDKNNILENVKQMKYLYKQSNLVLLLRGTENKYKALYQGPFSILQVYDNSTVCL